MPRARLSDAEVEPLLAGLTREYDAHIAVPAELWARPSVHIEQLTDPVARCRGCDGLALCVEIRTAGAVP